MIAGGGTRIATSVASGRVTAVVLAETRLATAAVHAR